MDETAARKITDENGEITKADFMKFGQDTKLLDFSDAGHSAKKTSSDKRKPVSSATKVSVKVMLLKLILYDLILKSH